ncbi:prominin-like protein [Cydia splendana]|uniref:prominin-like protein n=1 Tax=Cydia splendana TaxID=1100963 RepID=UPI00300D5995
MRGLQRSLLSPYYWPLRCRSLGECVVYRVSARRASDQENWRVLLVHYAGPTAFVVVAVLLAAALPLAGRLEIASQQENWRVLLAHYAGPTAFVVVAVLLAAALPLAGRLEIASQQENWRVLLAHYAGPTAFVVVAVLLAAALPLAGLFWCCCYWCRSGRRRRTFDRKYDACLKGLLAIVLIGLLTLFLFGVVCAFATEEQLDRSASEAPNAVRSGIKDTKAYLNATQAHVRWLLVNNYAELERTLDNLLTTSEAPNAVRSGIKDTKAYLNATQAHVRWLLVNNYAELERTLDNLLTTSEAPNAVRSGIKDTKAYLNATQAHVRWLLVNNYAELERTLDNLLTTSEAPNAVRSGIKDTKAYLNATQAHVRWLLVNNYAELERTLDNLLTTSEAPNAVRSGIKDTKAYLNATQAHVRWLLVNNYAELERTLDNLRTNSGTTVSRKLGEFSHAVSVTTLYNMVQQLDTVQADLKSVHNITSMLRNNAELLNSGLRKVKAQLLQTLAKCEQPQCIRLQEKYKIGQLDTEIQYSQMPDVSELLNNVTELLDSHIKADVEEGQQVFANIQAGIQRSVDDHIPNVKEALAETGRKLKSMADRVTALSNNASAKIQEHSAGVADHVQEYYEAYGPYRRHAGRAAAASLLLITCVVAWGLVCGVCGKRPDVYGASDCCNKGAGSRYLLCGMGVMFIVGGVVSLVMAVYFVVGVSSQRFLCDPLTNPQGNRLFEELDRFVDLENFMFNERRDPDFNLSRVLTYCHRNQSLMQTLQLYRLIDLESLKAQASQAVDRKAAALRPTFPGHDRPVTILKPQAKLKLTRLAESGLSDFDFDRILHALETNMTNLSLDTLATQLDATANSLVDRSGFVRVSIELRDAAVMLTAYHTNIVTPMLEHTRLLNVTATRLRDGLRFNHSSLKEAIGYLIHETSQAETFLNRQGLDVIQTLIQDFAKVVAQRLNEYLDMVTHAAEHEVGCCAPMSNAFNATRDAACKKILMPVNGYWMALAWCVLLFVPFMVAAQRLARLYRHVDPYPGPLVEAEYLYDAFADRDNVPLANAYKAEKRAGREARRGAGGAGGAGGAREEARGAALAAPLDAHHARRYNDMAPKHWEEGPPRYHGPTEYERPPPYYYPGPTDRQ